MVHLFRGTARHFIMCAVALMKRNSLYLVVGAVVFLMTAATSTPTLRSQEKNDNILCQVSVISETLPQQPSKTYFVCEATFLPDFEDGNGLPPVFHFHPSSDTVRTNQEALKNYEWYITFPSDWLSTDSPTPTINVPVDEEVTTIDPVTAERLLRRRSGMTNTQTKPTRHRWTRETKPAETAFVVLISSSDAGPGYSISEARRIVFGNGTPGEVSAASQFSACSFGEFELVPYGEGVIEVQVDNPANQYTRYTIRSEAETKLCESWNAAACHPAYEKGIDHLIYVVPFGLTSDSHSSGFGLGEVGGSRATFQGRAFAPATILHEIGHNFYLGHAGESGFEYGDYTGQMGSSLYGNSIPADKRCFNGQNMWEMGWLKDRRYHADPTVPFKMKLATFVDYDQTSPDQYVYIRIGDYYLTYNIAKGMNEHSAEYKNSVLVIQKVPDEVIGGYFDTELRAALSTSDRPFTVANYNNGTAPLIIEVCEMITGPPDYAILAIGLDADCDELTEANTAMPAPMPSPPPTRVPTLEPTKNPTSSPTSFPTTSPTFVPTRTPTFAPTGSPTLTPTLVPTESPSIVQPSTAPKPKPPTTTEDQTTVPTSAPSSGNDVGSEKKRSGQCLGKTDNCESNDQCCADQNLYCEIQNGEGTCQEKPSDSDKANLAAILGSLIPILALLPILLCCVRGLRTNKAKPIETTEKTSQDKEGFKSSDVPGTPSSTADTTSLESPAPSSPMSVTSLGTFFFSNDRTQPGTGGHEDDDDDDSTSYQLKALQDGERPEDVLRLYSKGGELTDVEAANGSESEADPPASGGAVVQEAGRLDTSARNTVSDGSELARPTFIPASVSGDSARTRLMKLSARMIQARVRSALTQVMRTASGRLETANFWRQALVPRQVLSTRNLQWPSSVAAAGGRRLENRTLIGIDEEKSTSCESRTHPSVNVMQVATDNCSGLKEGQAADVTEVDASNSKAYPLEAGLENDRKSRMSLDKTTSKAKPWFLSWLNRSQTSWEGFDASRLAIEDSNATTSELESGIEVLCSDGADVSRREEKANSPKVRFM